MSPAVVAETLVLGGVGVAVAVLVMGVVERWWR